MPATPKTILGPQVPTDQRIVSQVTARLKTLPPDPEGQNDQRAGWADDALSKFMSDTRMNKATEDVLDALPDLLANFMHWCDRNNQNFNDALRRARAHYKEETQE